MPPTARHGRSFVDRRQQSASEGRTRAGALRLSLTLRKESSFLPGKSGRWSGYSDSRPVLERSVASDRVDCALGTSGRGPGDFFPSTAEIEPLCRPIGAKWQADERRATDGPARPRLAEANMGMVFCRVVGETTFLFRVPPIPTLLR